MNVDLLIKENQELNEEKQRYKEMWFNANNSLAKYRKLEEQLGCPLEVRERALQQDEIFYVERYQTKMIRVVAMNCGYINNGECVLNCLSNDIWFCLPVKDYKKTWWLKSDRSE